MTEDYDVEKELTFEDIDILGSIGSDFCESIRDLITILKKLKKMLI